MVSPGTLGRTTEAKPPVRSPGEKSIRVNVSPGARVKPLASETSRVPHRVSSPPAIRVLATVVANGGAATVVGFDGETYLRDLSPENDVEVTLPNTAPNTLTCHARFRFEQEPGSMPRIGPLTCQ